MIIYLNGCEELAQGTRACEESFFFTLSGR
jgi:hypothetical protein